MRIFIVNEDPRFLSMRSYMPLIGVFVGFVLSEAKNCLAKSLTSKAFKKMLHIEIDRNILLAKNILDEVSKVSEGLKKEIHEYKNDELFKLSKYILLKLSKVDPPIWADRIWKSDAKLVVDSLREEQIKEIYVFHDRLDRFLQLHNEIASVVKSSNEIGLISDNFDYIGFANTEEKYWAKYNKLASEIINSPNPIKKNFLEKLFSYLLNSIKNKS